MEKQTHSMLRRLARAMEQSEQDRLLAKADGLSPKGQKKLNDKLSDYHTILTRKSVEARIEMIDGFIDNNDYDNLVAIFNEAVALVFNLVFNLVFSTSLV